MIHRGADARSSKSGGVLCYLMTTDLANPKSEARNPNVQNKVDSFQLSVDSSQGKIRFLHNSHFVLWSFGFFRA